MSKKKSSLVTIGIATLVLLSATWCVHECRKRKRQAVMEERMRVRGLIDKYMPALAAVSESEVEKLSSLHARAADAYESRDPRAVREALKRVPEVVGRLSWETSQKVDAPLSVPYNRIFLRTSRLLDFTDCAEFEKFMRINLEIAMHFGGLEARRKSIDALTGRDYLTYQRILRYRDKFRLEKKSDLESLAERFLDEWAAQIESTNGFTRVAIREDIRLNSEYAEARWPGRGWSREDCCRAARARARGLIKVGYTPKWLDTDYPDPDAAKKPVARPSP